MKIQAISGIEHGLWTSGHHSLNSQPQDPWTKNELDQLKNFVDQNLSPTIIAQKMGRSVFVVKKQAVALGLKLSDSTS